MKRAKLNKLSMKKVLLATVLLGSVMGTTIAYVGNTAYAAESYITGSQNTNQSWLVDDSTGWEYDIVDNDNTKCIIRPSATLTSLADVTIPESIKIPNKDNPEEFTEYTVVAIMSNAWKGNTTLKTVSLPDSVVELGDSAFEGCTNLTTIKGVEHVSILGKQVFKDCTSIASITLGDVDTLMYNTFENCTGLTEVKIGNINEILCDASWTGVVGSAVTANHTYGPFNGCTNLKKITLGNVAKATSQNISGGGSITGHDCTFAGLNSLETIVVGDYPEISQFSGLNNDNIKTIKFGNVGSIGNSKFSSPAGGGVEYYSILGKGLVSAEFEGVSELSQAAFKGLENLNYVDIGVVEEIPREAFSGCENLQHFDFSGVKSIGDYAFDGSGLLEVETGDLDRVGVNAFRNCKYLKTIKFGDIGELSNYSYVVAGTVYVSSFSGCKNLEYFECGDVSNIPEKALSGVSDKLTTVVVGDVDNVSNYAFSDNVNLEFFTCGTIGNINDTAFENTKISGLATVTLHNADGEGVKQTKVAKGTLATRMSAGKNGTKIFTGWYTDDGLTNPFTGVILGDMELYAGYIDEVYYVDGEGQRVGEGGSHTIKGQDELGVYLSSVPNGEVTYQWYWIKPGSNYGNGTGFTPPSRIHISGANDIKYTVADEYSGYAIGCYMISNGYQIDISDYANVTIDVDGEPSDNLPEIKLNGIRIYGDTRTEGGVLRTEVDPNAATGTYQWYRSDTVDGDYTPIEKATDSKYTITSDDIEKYIKVEFTGTEYSEGQKVESEPAYIYGEIKQLLDASIIDRSTQKKVGDTLEATAIASGYTGNVPSAYLTYQWYRDEKATGTFGEVTDTAIAIKGANESTYILTTEDIGMRIFVAITGKEDEGFTGTEVSEKISSNVAPTIATQVDAYRDNVSNNNSYLIGNTSGKIDTIWTAKLDVPEDVTVSYQWYRDSGAQTSGSVAKTANDFKNFDDEQIPSTAEAIPGANSSTYTSTAADVGYRLFLVVKGTGNTAYMSRTSSTKGVTTGSLAGQKIEGISNVGETLTMTTDYDEYFKDGDISYQWYRSTSKTSPANPNRGDSYEIEGAVNREYTITEEDIGNYIHCVVYSSNSANGWSPIKGYADITYGTEKVTANIKSATIEGIFKEGETLTISTTPDKADVSVSWYRNSELNDSSDEGWDLIETNDGEYTISSEDVGYYIKAVVTGQNGYTGEVTATPISKVATDSIEITSADFSDTDFLVGDTVSIVTNPSEADTDIKWYKATNSEGASLDYVGSGDSLELDDSLSGFYIIAKVTGINDYTGYFEVVSDKAVHKKQVESATLSHSGELIANQTTINLAVNPEGADVDIIWYRVKDNVPTEIQNGGTSYKVTDSDIGYQIKAVVTGKNLWEGTAEDITSEVVQAASEPSEDKTEIGNVALEGKPEVGETLEVVIEPEGATADIEWIKVKDGEETPIEGENGNSYVVKPEDEGYQIKVVVTGNGDYTGEKEFTSSVIRGEEAEEPSVNPGERIPTSHEHVDYTTIDTDDVYNGYDQGVEVYVSQGQDIAIRLPFKTVLDGTKGRENKADFEVEVRANISGSDNIKVVPETDFVMTTVGKKPINGTVEIDQVEYNIAKDGEDELSAGKVVNGKVSVENLSAGHWEGDFDWEIKVEGLKINDSEEGTDDIEVQP